MAKGEFRGRKCQLREWESGVEEGKAKGRGLNLFFFSGGPKDARQPGKKKGLEGSREAREMELIMHGSE